jgi:hypothetical protein
VLLKKNWRLIWSYGGEIEINWAVINSPKSSLTYFDSCYFRPPDPVFASLTFQDDERFDTLSLGPKVNFDPSLG